MFLQCSRAGTESEFETLHVKNRNTHAKPDVLVSFRIYHRHSFYENCWTRSQMRRAASTSHLHRHLNWYWCWAAVCSFLVLFRPKALFNRAFSHHVFRNLFRSSWKGPGRSHWLCASYWMKSRRPRKVSWPLKNSSHKSVKSKQPNKSVPSTDASRNKRKVVLKSSDAPIMIFRGRFRYRFFSSKLADSDSDTDFFFL